MKFIRSAAIIAAAVILGVLLVSCETKTFEFRDDKYIIKTDFPDGYIVYDCNSKLDSSNEAQAKIIERKANGMVIDAVNPQTSGEFTFYVTRDNLSEAIGNFQTVSDEVRADYISEYQKTLVKSDHILLSNPEIVTVNGVDCVRILARVGSSTGGYSYISYITVINGEYYESTVYMPQSIPSEEEVTRNERILKSVRIDVQGLSESLGGNALSQALTIAVTVVACLVMLAVAGFTIRHFVRKSRRQKEIRSKITQRVSERKNAEREGNDDKRA